MADPTGEADAAEQRHGEEDDRFREGELVRAHVGEAAGKQAAAEAAEQRAQREGRDLGAIDVDASDARGELIVAHRAHRAAETRIRQAPDEIADDGERCDTEGEIGLLAGEQVRARNVAHAVRAVGDGNLVDHEEGEDLLEGDRHHRSVEAPSTAPKASETTMPMTRQIQKGICASVVPRPTA